jgi:hypothetical protein
MKRTASLVAAVALLAAPALANEKPLTLRDLADNPTKYIGRTVDLHGDAVYGDYHEYLFGDEECDIHLRWPNDALPPDGYDSKHIHIRGVVSKPDPNYVLGSGYYYAVVTVRFIELTRP